MLWFCQRVFYKSCFFNFMLWEIGSDNVKCNPETDYKSNQTNYYIFF
jgi:hypothetical protein